MREEIGRQKNKEEGKKSRGETKKGCRNRKMERGRGGEGRGDGVRKKVIEEKR